MSIDEAIKWQETFKKTYNGYPKDVDEACDMAIRALKFMQETESIFERCCYEIKKSTEV